MEIVILVCAILVAAGVSVVATMAIQRKMARSRANTILAEAERDAEVIKEKKLLEAREEELRIKGEAERQAQQRLQRVQAEEGRIKQRQNQLNQLQSETQRARNENDQTRQQLEAQRVTLENNRAELDKLIHVAQENLEQISGLTADAAKERLIESLRDEAKTAAAGYINDIMDEAKLTANKEAKRIVVQTIQRVATETAIENSVTVFHIDSDEIKGRIIGVKAETYVPSKPLPESKSLSTTLLRLSFSADSTPCAAKSPASRFISSLSTAAFILPVSRKSSTKSAVRSKKKLSRPANALP